MRRFLKAAGVATAAAALGAVAERFVIAAPHYHGPRSNHFDGETFHNLDRGWQSEGSFVKWMMNRERGSWREWVDAPPGPKPPNRVDGGRLRVTFVNHATMLIQMDGVNLLTDPIWSERCSPVSFAGPKRHRPPGIRFADLPPIDAVLVSHNHYDHLDIPTLWQLRVRFHPRVITPLGNSLFMARHGLGGAAELDWWQEIPITDRVKVTLVPSRHFCARGLSDRNRTLWGGFVISGPSGNVYFAGDTGFGRHFAMIAEKFPSVRLALLPIGAYLPRWFMQPAHISPQEAVQAHNILHASMSIPMHYGTFNLGDDGEVQPLDDLRIAIAANGTQNFRITDFGEGVEVP
ncbi:MAG: MBL fold metallo-hydrolase [Thermoanaerobaculia bacterium]